MMNGELYWLAGYLEGEGSFAAYSNGSGIKIELASTDYDVVQKVAVLFESKVGKQVRPDRPKSKMLFRVSIHGLPAVKLMLQIYPLMGQRRQQQIVEALDQYKKLQRLLGVTPDED